MLILIFAGLVAFTAVNLWWRYEDETREAERRATNLTHILDDHLQRSIDSIDITLAQLANFGEQVGTSAPAEIWNPQLRTAFNALSSVGSLSVLDKNGTIVRSTITDIIGQSRGDNFLFRELASPAEAALVADAPFLSPRNGRILLPLGRRLNAPDGKFAGAVVATLELERLRAFYSSINVDAHGAIWVFHPAGFLLLRQPSNDAATNAIVPDHPLLQAAAMHKIGLLRAPLERNGEFYISAYRTLSNPTLVVAVSFSEKDIFETWFSENKAAVGLLAVSGAALLLAWLLIDHEMRRRLTADMASQKAWMRFKQIFDFAPLVVAVKDLQGKYVFVNRGYEVWTQRNTPALIGKTIRDIFGDGKYADDHEAMDREVVESRSILQREFITPQPQGGTRTSLFVKFPLLDASRKVEAIGSIALDITDRKRADAAVERIFETSVDLIFIVDPKGNFIRVSPSSEMILGYRPDEMEGHSAVEFIHPDDLASTRDEMRQARRGHSTRHFESRYFHKDGHEVTLTWTGVWSEPEQQHFFIGRDMTDRLKLERELRQTQKMEAIGQLTGGIAHDYNNLLTVILGNAELLTEALRDQPELHALAQMALDAADRSATLTQRLLAFGRGQALESKATDVNELLVNIVELIGPTLGEHVKVERRLGEGLWHPVVDRGQLETTIVNLAVNARDAMPMGGTLIIETMNAVIDEDYVSLNPGAKEGEYVVIAVSDTGSGMTPEVLARVYEPFFTTKGVGKGTGLGLSMIYGFVKQSGGHIAIYSEVNVGTVVRLYFPRADAPVAPSISGAVDETAVPTGTETILLVEDDPMVRAHAERQIASFGYRVHSAGKGSEAIKLIDDGLKPDLLLTDVIMPGGMNGRELADELRKSQPDLKVLFTSGYTQGALDSAERISGSNFLSKPFRRAELAAKIRDLLDEKMLADV
ncbi:MAG TPA: PAS domain S-box protein [Xanthobacteraceae bacterium]|nr:PAS domain S-box protein [Xanthobacteraceae bacterium]